MFLIKQTLSPLVLLVGLSLVAVGCSSEGSTETTESPAIAADCEADVVYCNDTGSVEGPGDPLPTNPDEPVTDPDLGGAVSVQQATEHGDPGPIVVTGFFFNDGSTARLCDLIAESFPPQCGGASLIVVNPEDLVDVPLVEEGTSQWSDGFVVVSATVAGDELTILSP